MESEPPFSSEELERLRAQRLAGEECRCPRCDRVMTRRAIGGGSFGLGYARSREWLICPNCRGSALFDVRRGTRN